MEVVTNKNTELALKLLKACMNCSVLDTKDYVGVLGFCLALNKQEGELSSSTNLRLLFKSKTLHFNDYFSKDIPVLLFATIGSILKEEPEIDYQELYEEIIYIVLKDYQRDYRLLVDKEIPKEVFRFITELNGGFNGLDVYIPIAGGASFCLADNNSRTFGYEGDAHVWLIGFFRLMFKGMESDLYINKDFLDLEGDNVIKYDAVLVTLPCGWPYTVGIVEKSSLLFEDYRHTDSQTYAIEHALMKMKEGGVSYIFVKSSFLKEWQQETFFKLLLKQKYLQKVILFPKEIWHDTCFGEFDAIIVLKKNETEKVCFIDATSFSQKTDDRTFELKYEDLLSAINKGDNKYIRYIYDEDIIVNRYCLYPKLYFMTPSIRPEIPSGYRYLKIREFLKPIENDFTMDWKDLKTVCKTNGGKGQIIESKDLTPHKFSYAYKCAFWNKTDMINGEIYTELDKDLILIPNFGSFYENPMLYVHGHSLLDVYITNSVKAFDYDPSLIDPLYFCHEFQEEYIQVRLEHNKMINFPISDFDEILDIKMKVPSIEVQKNLYHQKEINFWESKLQKASSDFDKIIKQIHEDVNNQLKIQRHCINDGYLGAIKDYASLLSDYIAKNNLGDDYVVPSRGYTLNMLMADMNERIKNMAKKVSHLTTVYEVGKKEELDLCKRIYDFKSHGNYIINHYIDEKIDTKEGAIVSFNNNCFDDMMGSIINNAVKHGFTDPRNKHIIEIKLSLDDNDKMYILQINNNGSPLPDGMDTCRYGLRGETAGKNGNEGIGGYIVKTVVEHFKGELEIKNMPNSTFPVRIIIKLPYNN